jgi:hypothetical protein
MSCTFAATVNTGVKGAWRWMVGRGWCDDDSAGSGEVRRRCGGSEARVGAQHNTMERAKSGRRSEIEIRRGCGGGERRRVPEDWGGCTMYLTFGGAVLVPCLPVLPIPPFSSNLAVPHHRHQHALATAEIKS